ncbi:MAG: hypothetical protein AAGI38_09685 [Bacteroidota bacterium]
MLASSRTSGLVPNTISLQYEGTTGNAYHSINIYNIEADNLSINNLIGYPKKCSGDKKVDHWVSFSRPNSGKKDREFFLNLALDSSAINYKDEKIKAIQNILRENVDQLLFAGCYDFLLNPSGKPVKDHTKFYFLVPEKKKLYEFESH